MAADTCLKRIYRRDASENFAPDKRWGTFASASIGWVVSEEKFFEPLKNKIILEVSQVASALAMGPGTKPLVTNSPNT